MIVRPAGDEDWEGSLMRQVSRHEVERSLQFAYRVILVKFGTRMGVVRARHVTPENEPGLHTCTAFLMIPGPKRCPFEGRREGHTR